MVLTKGVTLSFPCNTLQLINYSTATYVAYDILLPNITSDSQLGTEITLIKTNAATINTVANTSGLYIGRQGSNVIYNFTSGASQITTSLNYVSTTATYYKFMAIKNQSSVYAWIQIT